MTLYERIRQLRIEANMTQDDLARAMGYKDRSMITKIESGKVDISQKKVTEFAKVLNTTPAYLMGWTDNESSERKPEDPKIRAVSFAMEDMPEDDKEYILSLVLDYAKRLKKKG